MIGERSYELITDTDLRRLGKLAATDRESLFARRPQTGRLYRDRLFAVALCQGAALHWVNGINGVKDFDVWSFYVAHPKRPYPYRRIGCADFGDPKFGTSPGSHHFVGRRVDLLGRSIKLQRDPEVLESLRQYLSRSKPGSSAWHLAAKAVVLIEPKPLRGLLVWPVAT